ncbi:tRNA pseudouridine(55) synthase TruB [Virgibacillus sp. W0430]|uniref:tRNA pseudouridine(55) synthase TruB n=1 Tax=Virgibacillus sp. W0430 TaxID=3391580 RepID=UPI003F475A3A
MNGILPLWKPKGLTSHDCVAKIRKLYGTKKVGHTGTLDPEVEGVLPICIGQATKLVPFMQEAKKTYIARIVLGTATETEDAEGAIIEQKVVMDRPSSDRILRVLELFKGEITQIPPMYSAVKVQGKRLYEYARAKQTVERPSRLVTIYEIEKLSELDESNSFEIKVVCSKGTYIRTLCVDIGKKLGFPAHMGHLIRTESCTLTAMDTVQFADIEREKTFNNEAALLLPMLSGLKGMDRIEVDGALEKKVLHGQVLDKPTIPLNTDPFLIIRRGELLGIYETHPKDTNKIKPIRIFNG